MMKKLIYILSLVFLTGACESILDLEPKNSVTFDHYFNSERDLEAVVAEVHSLLRTALCGVNYQTHIGLKVDYVKGGSDYVRLRRLDPTIIASRYKQEKWRPYYNVLNIVDLYFDNYRRAEGVAESRVNFYSGQCYFARAVCYWKLAQIWGDAVITKGSTYVEKYAKSPAAQVVDTAIAAAEKAYRLLPKYGEMKNSNKKALVSKQYGCKGSAAGVLVHLYAWKGCVLEDREALKKAVAWADTLMNPDYAGTYTLPENPEEVCTKELLRRGEGSVFELEISYTDNSTYSTFIAGAPLIGWPVMRNTEAADIIDKQYGITVGMVNSMYEQGDLRRTSYFYEPDEPGRNLADLAYLYKWRNTLYRETATGEAGFVGFDANKVMIRLADIYLLRAECKAKLGDRSGAMTDLNLIREKARATAYPEGPNDVDTENGLVWAIFRERERELLYEGHRYYDIVRNYYYDPGFLKEFADDFPALSNSDIADGALYLPVPETAFNYNDLMVQNIYWLSKMQ